MKKVAISVLGMAFAFMASSASAVVIEDFGLAPDPSQGEVGVVTLPLVNFLDVGPIEEEYLFTLDQEALVSTSVESLFNDDAGFVFIDIDNLETSLTGPNGTTVFPGTDVPGDGAFSNSGTLTLGPGAYSFLITGDAVGRTGGAYIGAITVITDVSAIPIPAAGLLFFSGIAALGLVRSKRASA